MVTRAAQGIEERVAGAAERALVERRYVGPIDVLIELGWLAPSHVDAWRHGRVADLESVATAGRGKLSTALRALQSWADQRGLRPMETAYLARSRDRRARKRYERQGVLVEEAALDQAERQCLADAGARARRREREEARRAAEDDDLETRIAGEIRRLFPACPTERAAAIARHTATRGSGRIGRTPAARALDSDAIERAVIASVRHLDTGYDRLLMSGVEREEARARVQSAVAQTLDAWRDTRGRTLG